MAENNLAKQIGTRLRQARQGAGYKTISDFISKHNFPKSTYNQYEIGARSLGIESAVKFAQLFKTNLIWLTTGKGSPRYSDDEIVKNIPERLSEAEFLSIIKAEKELPSTKYKTPSKKRVSEQDITLLADIFSKVLNCYQIEAKDVDLKYVSEIAIGIYFDAVQTSSNREELQNMINSAISTLSRTLSRKKHSG